jgi:hypothetical protein
MHSSSPLLDHNANGVLDNTTEPHPNIPLLLVHSMQLRQRAEQRMLQQLSESGLSLPDLHRGYEAQGSQQGFNTSRGQEQQAAKLSLPSIGVSTSTRKERQATDRGKDGLHTTHTSQGMWFTEHCHAWDASDMHRETQLSAG